MGFNASPERSFGGDLDRIGTDFEIGDADLEIGDADLEIGDADLCEVSVPDFLVGKMLLSRSSGEQSDRLAAWRFSYRLRHRH
jgi:hypothetical protein